LPGEATFTAGGGRSSNGTLPFYKVQWTGGGVCVGIGWSGQWKATVARRDGVTVKTGIEQVHTILHPGENIRMPRVLVVHWDGDDPQRANNFYHRLAIQCYTPRIEGKSVFPIMAHCSAWDELRNANEKNQLDILRACKKAGLEGYWLDAYWFEGYFGEGVGNWAIPIEKTVRKKDYPNGLKPLYEECQKLGLKFVLWFEPEHVSPGTWLDVNYPQWVLRVNQGVGGLYNLGDPEARQWMTDYLCQCIAAYHLDVLRIDCNGDPLSAWRANDAPNRQGMNEIRYVMGLYQMWDDIRAKFPHLFIDNCASGGRRIDLETNMRSIPMWRSDCNDTPGLGDPMADQGMTMGLTPFMPINSGPVSKTDPYCWRCGSSGGPIAYWDPRKNNYSIEESKQAVAESQELRPYALGDFWQLTENNLDPRVWVGWQYHRPAEDDGYAVFFRRQDCPYSTMDASLRGVSADKKYEVRYYHGYAMDKKEVRTGKELQNLAVDIPKRQGSLLIRYEPVRR
jgi:alpha-galactosidase